MSMVKMLFKYCKIDSTYSALHIIQLYRLHTMSADSQTLSIYLFQRVAPVVQNSNIIVTQSTR